MNRPRTNSLRALFVAALVGSVAAGCARAPMPSAQGPRDLGPVTAAAFKGGKPATVSVTYPSRQALSRFVAAGLEVWYVDQEAGRAFGAVTAEALPELQRAGANVRLVQSPGAGAYNDFDKGYRTYDQIKADMQALAARHPDFIKFVDIGDGWEKTNGKGDRDVLALHIGKGDVSQKPAVMLCGNHHAREIVTPEIVMRIADMLAAGYGTDADLTNYVENRDIWLVPMVNPDGHRLASEGKDWRKNTNPTNGGGAVSGASGPGVDLNRNYGFKWGGPGAATNPSNPTFRGAGPFSEPETQAIKRLIESRKWTFLMTYHSFSNLILWPWGHTDQPPPDKRLAPIGQKLGKLSGYKPQQSVKLYPTSGDTTDWAFGEHGILAYTTEIGSWADGFDPSFSKVPTFWKQNEPGARLLLQLADNPAHVFGPEVTEVAAAGGQLAVASQGAVEVETFVGRAGRDGTGVKVAVAQGRAQVNLASVATTGRKELVLVHARDAAGNWGPLRATFSR
ncbi:MAG: M14 family metallopeptidase [Candidatus Sericytochromatia bacterium]|nr:M14 family metallopeptidase [Candidatus Sericytochromatia bacterium]